MESHNSQSPIIDFTEINRTDFFCRLLKNIKLRTTLTDSLLIQEMQILNQVIEKTYAVELRIIHDYKKLPEIVDSIIAFIKKRTVI